MRNKNQNNMCDVTRDLQTLPLLQTATFSQTPPYPGAWSTLCAAVKRLLRAIQLFRAYM